MSANSSRPQCVNWQIMNNSFQVLVLSIGTSSYQLVPCICNSHVYPYYLYGTMGFKAWYTKLWLKKYSLLLMLIYTYCFSIAGQTQSPRTIINQNKASCVNGHPTTNKKSLKSSSIELSLEMRQFKRRSLTAVGWYVIRCNWPSMPFCFQAISDGSQTSHSTRQSIVEIPPHVQVIADWNGLPCTLVSYFYIFCFSMRPFT